MKATVGVIGVGNMGSALVKGWLRSGDVGLTVWDTYLPAVERLMDAVSGPEALAEGRSGTEVPVVAVASSLAQLVDAADTLVVVVKPKDAKELLGGLRGSVRPEQIIVSAMAGLRLELMREILGPVPTLFRVMPNLAVELREGAVAIAAERGAEQSAVERTLELFGRLGLAEIMPEELFDVFTAVSGSSPAFLALAIEGLEDGAVAAGLSRTEARRVVREAALKVAQKGAASDESDLISDEVSDLGGDETDGAIKPGKERVMIAFRAAVTAAMERSRNMSKT